MILKSLDMKKYSILLMVFAALAICSCQKDKDFVHIDSLQVFGDEFYQGAVVNLAMSVHTSDPYARYEWFCEAGTLRLSQQGYTVMKWTAPMVSGEYTVGCTVTSGGVSETRTAKIKVNGTFFDRIAGSTLTGWSKSSNTSAFVVSNGRASLQVNPTATSPTDSIGTVTRAMGVTDFYPPVSFDALMGIDGSNANTYSPKYPVTSVFPYAEGTFVYSPVDPSLVVDTTWKVVAVPTIPAPDVSRNTAWDNFMGMGLTGKAPAVELAPTHYISEIRIDWWPIATHLQTPLGYYSISDDPTAAAPPSSIAATDFNARVAFRWVRRQDTSDPMNLIPESSGWVMIPFQNAAFEQGVDVDKIVGIALTEDYTINVMVNKQIVHTTDGLKTWRNTWNPGCLFSINEMKMLFPRGTRLYFDDMVANNSEEFMY
jgi:hypothetical protein